MGQLSKEQVLKEKETHNPNAITSLSFSLSLSHKALSDVSCLSEFNNLERLDLAFNSLTSLEGLKSCANLKWLSVVQNKLTSLKGIEELSKLTVINAGKNKLRTMDEVKSLASIRALILNDNEIRSIGRLDQLKELNTLVLSRNPICEIGEALMKVKSISKVRLEDFWSLIAVHNNVLLSVAFSVWLRCLSRAWLQVSLSNCQMQAIGSSLKFCTELKELRLAYNEIQTIPAELAGNKKLQNLDLGNNVITRWSDLKVLGSLSNLRNLNLQGNPIAENEKLAKKVKKLLPNLQIFNARPIDKRTKNEKNDRVEDSSLDGPNKLNVLKGNKKDHTGENESKHHSISQNKNVEIEKKPNKKHPKEEQGRPDTIEKPKKRKQKDEQGEPDVIEEPKKKIPKKERTELDIIDDGETPFSELFAVDSAENPTNDAKKKIDEKVAQELKSVGVLVTHHTKKKKKKNKNQGMDPELELSSTVEVGFGGPSTWDD